MELWTTSEYRNFWLGVRNLFVGLSLLMVLSNVAVVVTIVWAVKRFGR